MSVVSFALAVVFIISPVFVYEVGSIYDQTSSVITSVSVKIFSKNLINLTVVY